MHEPTIRTASPGLVLLLAATSCGTPTPVIIRPGDDGGDTTGASSRGDDGASGHELPPESETESSSDDGPDEPPVNFIPEPDGGGVSFECDLFAQDCAPGEKCTVWATDGGTAWNGTRCVPIVDTPDPLGEPCTVEGSATSGLDTCGFAAICWGVDPETLQGECVSYCLGSDANPTCPDPTMRCIGRNIPLCLPTCCPIEQDCDEDEVCVPDSDEFFCAPDASGDQGAFGDPCEYINVCDPGLLCLHAAAVPDCVGSAGCCSAFCTVGTESCSLLAPGLSCVPWYEEGAAPPGFELTGVCALPG